MANENLEDWKLKPSVYNETVLCAKKFLDDELARFDSWEDFQEKSSADLSIGYTLEISNIQNFKQCKKMGVGRNLIKKFLGKAWNDKTHIIQDALPAVSGCLSVVPCDACPDL